MPHEESWFSILLGRLYESLEHVAHALGWPFTEGVTWIEGAHIGVQHVVSWLFVVLLVVGMGMAARARFAKPDEAIVPEEKLTVGTFIELVVGSTYKALSDIMGAKAARHFLPLIGTCAFLILFSNALGLVPGFSAPTDSLNTTFACALIIFFATHIYGVKEHGGAYFKHFFGPIIKWYALPLMLLMLLIETISHLARPVTLAIRLAANMTAGHRVLGIFTGFGVMSFLAFPAAMYGLKVIVVVVQTLVFCLLAAVYISMAIAHEEH